MTGNYPCDRCHTLWPIDRMIVPYGQRLCEICWRVVIYPYKTVEDYKLSEACRLRRGSLKDRMRAGLYLSYKY